MRTTLKIDDDVLSVARALAARTGKSLGDAVSQLARRGFSERSRIESKDDLPRVQVRPDARPITTEDVRKALSDFP